MTLLVGRQEGIWPVEWWDGGVVICLEQGADLDMNGPADATATLASVKSTLVLPFWYWLTRVVPVKWLLKRVCVASGTIGHVEMRREMTQDSLNHTGCLFATTLTSCK